MDTKLTQCELCKRFEIEPIICESCNWTNYCSTKCKEDDKKSHDIRCKAFLILDGKIEKEFKKYKIERNAFNHNRFSCKAICDIKEGECILKEIPKVAIASNNNTKEIVFKGSENIYKEDDPKLIELDVPSSQNPELIGEYIRGKLACAIGLTYPWLGQSQVFPTFLTGTKTEKEMIAKIKDFLKIGQFETSLLYGTASFNAINIEKDIEPGSILFGFFPRSSLFNHSCLSNIEFTLDKKHLCFFACRDIKEGEELTIDFTRGRFDFIQVDTKRHIIKDLYQIDCGCNFCTEKIKEEETEKDDFEMDILVKGRGGQFLLERFIQDKGYFKKRPKKLIHLINEILDACSFNYKKDGIITFSLLLKMADEKFSKLEGHYKLKYKIIIGLFFTMTRKFLLWLWEKKIKVTDQVVYDLLKDEKNEELFKVCDRIKEKEILCLMIKKITDESTEILFYLDPLFQSILRIKNNFV